MTGDSMRPSTTWSQDAQQFGATVGGAKLLCVACIKDGLETPSPAVAFLDGTTYCLDHVRLYSGGSR